MGGGVGQDMGDNELRVRDGSIMFGIHCKL